ncbi:MAG: hypothetical protein Q9M40_10705 [Sulfurimonas sp.]|nr:hypothetical protein [Sulfurimonas sp.]MDQ7068391.1 hypothetical protein [Sulfurimonas sp.]
MYKYIILTALMLDGCANFTINGTMCDSINRESGAVVPQECRDYDEKEADRAFHKIKEEKKVSDKDIKFDKEEE